MKRILKSELDKFYTKPSVADILINKINLNEYGLVIEPSCGDGSFFNQLNHNNKIGIDIKPGIDNAIETDYLEWDPNIIDRCFLCDNTNVLVIGNPPFGKQGSFAMKFIKKSAEYSDTIAFILPLSFMKDSVKNRIPEYFHLRTEEILDENSFLLDGDNFNVKCCFQIWDKKDIKREKIKKIDPVGFNYTSFENGDADLSIRRVGVYAGKGSKDINKSKQSHYFIKLNDNNMIDFVISELTKIVWSNLTIGPRSISKSELNEILNEILNNICWSR